MSDAEIVVLVHAETPGEADAIVAMLTAFGVQAYAATRKLEDIFPTLFSIDGTAVMVRADDLDRARELLDAPSETA